MTPEEWEHIKTLIESAAEAEPSGHVASSGAETRADDGRLDAIEPRPQGHREAGTGRDELATVIDDSASRALSLTEDATGPAAGRRIGTYELTRELGRGGMGVVYLAERADDLFNKLVAIKVVKRGMDTDFVLRRFVRERQLMASLDHPNIARLIDGGVTADGLPYFVMEYVEGAPVDAYCDGLRLGVTERLELFRRICSAIQYAHQNLIVHRDIKPSNILVTRDGTPKLLDFGIAKLLKPGLAARSVDPTMPAARLMTPEYASPEQLRGETITTASDVYSLGVLLYELLAGHKPHRLANGSPGEFERAVCEEDPERPSAAAGRAPGSETTQANGAEESPEERRSRAARTTPAHVATTRGTQPESLRRRLAGDLDNIVLKCLRKEPQRRYASAEQLSEDIRRHLDGLPVAARRDTFAYRGAKFLKRHKAGALAAVLATLSLMAGVVAAAREARVAQAERARAERRFNDVRRLANSFLFEFHDAIKDLPGATPARQLLLKRALGYLDSLFQEAKNDPALQRELATAYEKVGDIQGKALDFNVGDTTGALESYRRALALREALVKADASSAENRRALADSYSKMGTLLWQTSERDAALENARRALEGYRKLAAEAPEDTALQNDLANNYLNVGMILLEQAKLAEALENERQALAIYEKLAARDPRNNAVRRALSRTYEKIGNVMMYNADVAGALELNRKALAIRSALAGENPNSPDFRRGVEISHEKIGDMLTKLGDINGALGHYRLELEICQSLADADPANMQLRQELSSPYERLGETLARLGRPAEALAHHRKALDIRDEAAAKDSSNLWKRWEMIESTAKVARLLAALGDGRSALEYCRKTQAFVEATPDAPTEMHFRRYRAAAYEELGKAFETLASNKGVHAQEELDHRRAARAFYQRSLDVWLEMRGRGLLTPVDAGKPAEIASEIARCAEALAKSK